MVIFSMEYSMGKKHRGGKDMRKVFVLLLMIKNEKMGEV